jgi:hypothetical protein
MVEMFDPSPHEIYSFSSKSKLYYDRQSVGQSILLSGTHLGPATNFSHSLFDYFCWQFPICWCGAPSLTRSRICTLQFLLGIASAAFLRSESHGIHEQSLLFLFLRLPQPGGPGSCICFLQEQISRIIPSGIGYRFSSGRVLLIWLWGGPNRKHSFPYSWVFRYDVNALWNRCIVTAVYVTMQW